ncbi:MAG TPA: alpha/beta hydrolase [Bacteroidia bacterium]|nr:alpha/beta hydrolase [Bacteroidia bacterium]
MYFNTHDNLQIYYEFRGNEQSDKKVLFLNGLTQSTIAWEFTIQPLLNDYHIILMDLVFQGKSAVTENYRNFDEHAQDVFGLINTIVRKPISIVGISYGSLVAQHFAVNYPSLLDKLILVSSFAHKTQLYHSIELSWKNALKIGGYDLLLDVMLPYVLGQPYFENPFIPIEVMKTMRKDLQPDPKSILKLMQATEERKDFLKELESVQAPTLIVHGRNDMLFPISLANAINAAIPNSNLEIIEQSGHTINLEAPQKLSQLIKDFIK